MYSFKVTINGERVKISGKFADKAVMEEAKNNVNALIIAKREDKTVDKKVTEWVNKTADSNSTLYDRLAELGLVDARIKPGTLAELIDVFKLSNADKKPRTIKNRQACCNILCGFFGAGKRVSSIKPSDADKLWGTW